jgi:endoribonuclease Dicer
VCFEVDDLGFSDLSLFVFLVYDPRNNEQQKEDFQNIVQSELKMTEKALDRPENSASLVAPPTLKELESFRVDSTGAVLTTDSSITFMYRFCSKLPGDK